jgi:hypothetical protein
LDKRENKIYYLARRQNQRSVFSDKKDLTLNKNTTNNIVVSWLDSPELEKKYTQYEEINQAKTEVIDQ